MFELSSSSASKDKEVAFMADTDQESAPLVNKKQQSEDHLGIDIPEEDFEPGPECCIYKVPRRLREVNEKAYTPQLISIGPIHHGNKNLVNMERQKLRYLKKFCERTSRKTLEGFQNFIKENVKRIYKCYDEFDQIEIKFKDSEFVALILKDSVFIIEFFLRCSKKNDNLNDFLLNREWLNLEFWIDLILLENQLPFFVLEGLYNLAFGSYYTPSFLHLACDYFGIEEDLYDENEIKHFTDLLRCVVARKHPSTSSSDERIDKVYSATKLREAGVHFKAVKDTNLLLDVQFEKGELRIPTLKVGHGTEAMIRNMMALEQCHYPGEAYVCSYIRLLDYLVDTDKDVDLLVKKGIFVNGMGSSAAAANMINTLKEGVAQAELPLGYDKIGKDLNQYRDNFWNRSKATLKRVYFHNLWRGTATLAASMLLLLTLTQTVFTILEQAKPTK